MVHRKGDPGSGHGCWPPRPNTQGSPNVNVNNIPCHRKGDAWAPHTCPAIPETHGSVLAAGSPNINVNNKPMARKGDPVACGSVAVGSSPDVRANG